MIERIVSAQIKNNLFKGKAIILLGPRQVGKTTLLKNVFSTSNDVLWLNADNIEVQELLEVPSATRLKKVIGKNKIVIIDEAQRIKDVGIKLKIIIDEIKDVQLIVTGSSSFDISNKINEPLTGRKFEYLLFPVSFSEMVNHHQLLNEINLLKHRLVYGYYPEIVTCNGNEKELLNELANSYLFKDIFIWNKIKKADKLIKLIRALAFQIGQQVSYHELGQTVGLDNETVETYIQLLEKSYVIFRLSSFSRNLRNELKKSQKIYFYDNGIRNTLISNFNSMELRNDVGSLWENFLVSERKKQLSYQNIYTNCYFWRTQAQQEIDYIEERNGKLYAFELKWNKNKNVKFPKSFLEAYPESETKVISSDNFEEFIS
ncbi:MAG: ATPase [Bacteroidetes bacterium CG23_combo_of_CG06-09_8_20_14_all_32_9]|nr:MAG: ATPase [Bacteroidetes bacterium CG23_combo_of_CG06-09_8_20_14_all_32_9]